MYNFSLRGGVKTKIALANNIKSNSENWQTARNRNLWKDSQLTYLCIFTKEIRLSIQLNETERIERETKKSLFKINDFDQSY